MNCPTCNKEMEMADYLETEDGLVSDLICMNDDCSDLK